MSSVALHPTNLRGDNLSPARSCPEPDLKVVWDGPVRGMVGVVRFELTTSRPRTERADLTALHPDFQEAIVTELRWSVRTAALFRP